MNQLDLQAGIALQTENMNSLGIPTFSSDGQLTQSWFVSARSPDGNMTAFLQYNYGNVGQLIVLDHPDDAPRVLISMPNIIITPQAWSADSRYLVFAAWSASGASELFVIDANSSECQQLTDVHGAYSPAWSPDGSKIAFTTETGISIISPEDGTIRLLVNLAQSEGSPVWSPDGAQLSFLGSIGNEEHHLFLIDADGQHLRQLTDNAIFLMPVAPVWMP